MHKGKRVNTAIPREKRKDAREEVRGEAILVVCVGNGEAGRRWVPTTASGQTTPSRCEI